MSRENPAVALLRKVDVFELSGTDGCYCMSCAIRGVEIDVSCRKSSGTSLYQRIYPDFRGLLVRVHSDTMDVDMRSLLEVADLVREQIAERTEESIAVRLCDYRHDDKELCCYCDKPRESAEAYFCPEHSHMEPAAALAPQGVE